MRRDEQNERFRAVTEHHLRQTQGSLRVRQQNSRISAPMAAPQPIMSFHTGIFSNTQASSSHLYPGKGVQTHSYQTGFSGATMASHGQAASYDAPPFLMPETAHRTSANSIRTRDCSSRTSMRSGASSASHFDNDTFLTPGTSQDGHLDISNTASSTNSSLYLQPQVESGKHSCYPSFEPVETILPDQRRPSAPHNITTPVEPSHSELSVHPLVEKSVAWNGRLVTSQETSNTVESMMMYGELADHDAGIWPASYQTLNEPASTEYQPGFPENWDFSQDPSSLEHDERPGSGSLQL